jgi:hypothetical protein
MVNRYIILNKFDIVEERKKIKINELSKIACSDIPLFKQNKEMLLTLLKEKKHRLYFLSYLNKYRTSGKFDIPKHCFDNIGDIFNFILDVVENNDYESAKYCLILSQTYHHVDNGCKLSLQSKIQDHKLLKTVEFWENFIACKFF